MEFSVQAWRPHFRKDIDLLEGVQRRATKLITTINDELYEDRIRYLNLTTLDARRLRGDLVVVFEIFKGLTIWILVSFFILVRHIQEVTH